MPTLSVTVPVEALGPISSAYNDLVGAELLAAVKADLVSYLKLRVRKAQEEAAASAARAAVVDIEAT